MINCAIILLPLKIGHEIGMGILLFFVSIPNLSSVTGVRSGACEEIKNKSI